MSLPEIEYEALQAEKRDKMNARWQVWSILVGLIGAFGLVSLQNGATGYVVVLYPIIAACLTRFSTHSESVLDQVKAYLLAFEKKQGYQGYEHYNRAQCRRSSGGHNKALREAILCTDILAVIVLTVHLYLDHLVWLAILVCLFEGVVIYRTMLWFQECSGLAQASL